MKSTVVHIYNGSGNVSTHKMVDILATYIRRIKVSIYY